MPDESTFQDRKIAMPVTCRRCNKIFWPKSWERNGFLPVFCPACEGETSEVTAAQAMEELFGA